MDNTTRDWTAAYPAVADAVRATEDCIDHFPGVALMLLCDAGGGRLEERVERMAEAARGQALKSHRPEHWASAAEQMALPEFRKYLAARLGLM